MLERVQMRSLRRPHAGAAVGRPAAARRAGPRADHQPARAAARRAALGARRVPAPADARRAAARCRRELGITFIHVTHTQPEAIALADLVVVMDQGHIEQAASAREVYAAPCSPYVARFMGGQNVLAGRVTAASGARLAKLELGNGRRDRIRPPAKRRRRPARPVPFGPPRPHPPGARGGPGRPQPPTS